MDVASASDQIDRLIEKRAGERSAEEERAEMWRRSEARHRERIREANRAEWIDFYSRMCESHARIAEDFRGRAEALLGERRATDAAPRRPAGLARLNGEGQRWTRTATEGTEG